MNPTSSNQSLYPLSNDLLPDTGRVALVLGYDGSRYHGWQAQNSGVPSVQAEVEAALSKVADHPVSVVCAGRTDAGVHAVNQVVHFETKAQRSPYSWAMGVNHFLPADVSVSWAGAVSEDFHARYTATSRSYRYIIYNHPIRPAWLNSNVTWNYRPLDVESMAAAGAHLIGENDFSAFRGSDCQSKTPFRNLTRLEVSKVGDMVVIEVEANAFLHHMVRNISGTLMAVGTGKKPPDWVADVLASKKRSKAGVTAPPFGLYLTSVTYPEEFAIPSLQKGPFFLGA
ncbi:tRNA pseudouridine(38-40) synthase TruA [Hahella sp. HN01]|uniref:tRNA pseudouridine(38-40) synthase TruA n=1 Tax=Hahella sp. HN01 TaxID=2847262 RepID=UPI001C1F0D23|nr:tRNA pseudouridine(38-40) synthase TruA [Hahella sp. HN01]MBU6950809.1 tRNA pseudouridine(38-40) synthase TruA [Hahella sp. HN01]